MWLQQQRCRGTFNCEYRKFTEYPTEDIRDYMLKKEGEPIAKDEIIGETKGLFGLLSPSARSD